MVNIIYFLNIMSNLSIMPYHLQFVDTVHFTLKGINIYQSINFNITITQYFHVIISFKC